eukprot:TRINITY_DN386_c0_g1_i5.p1 TRINITY_DN386_c0_g1~~TRINITY_DN386_c0_g1_i5.p1  ORF type:complete len:433 (-),score=88.86 TRINITY_DN386_c0_g1_i5:628-1770(-)
MISSSMRMRATRRTRCVKRDHTNGNVAMDVEDADGDDQLKPARGKAQRPKKSSWNREMDEALQAAVVNSPGYCSTDWAAVAENLKPRYPRTSVKVWRQRWMALFEEDPIKGPWTPQEDAIVRVLVARHGTRDWALMRDVGLPQRTAKQIRERWTNHLTPNIKKDGWTKEEDIVLCAAYRLFGGSFAEFARLLLAGRPENTIKNHLMHLVITKPSYCWVQMSKGDEAVLQRKANLKTGPRIIPIKKKAEASNGFTATLVIIKGLGVKTPMCRVPAMARNLRSMMADYVYPGTRQNLLPEGNWKPSSAQELADLEIVAVAAIRHALKDIHFHPQAEKATVSIIESAKQRVEAGWQVHVCARTKPSAAAEHPDPMAATASKMA